MNEIRKCTRIVSLIREGKKVRWHLCGKPATWLIGYSPRCDEHALGRETEAVRLPITEKP